MGFFSSIKTWIIRLLFPTFIVQDFTICSCYMKITGLGRKSYAILAQALNSIAIIFYFWFGSGWSTMDSIFFLIILFADTLVLMMYLWWLKNPFMAVKFEGTYWNFQKIENFGVIGTYALFLFPFNLMFGFAFGLGFVIWIVTELFIIAVFCSDGPPKPDNTLPKTIKNKIKSLMPKPSYVPAPVGV